MRIINLYSDESLTQEYSRWSKTAWSWWISVLSKK